MYERRFWRAADKLEQGVGDVGVADDHTRLDPQAFFGQNHRGAPADHFNLAHGLPVANFTAVFLDCLFKGAADCHASAFGVISAHEVVTDPGEDEDGGVELCGRQAVVSPQGGEDGFKFRVLDELVHVIAPAGRHG